MAIKALSHVVGLIACPWVLRFSQSDPDLSP